MKKNEKLTQAALGTLPEYALKITYYVDEQTKQRVRAKDKREWGVWVPFLRGITKMTKWFSCRAATKTGAIRNLRKQRVVVIGPSRCMLHQQFYKEGVRILPHGK
jgi:hypothetical protein